MEIVHYRKKENHENSPFRITYGDKDSASTLQKLEKTLLMQMGNVLSIIHGGEYQKRRSNASA